MSVRRLAPKELQPASFTFTDENLAWAKQQIAKYPPGRQASAVIAILWRVQEQHEGWVSEAAIRAVADLLEHALHPRAGGRDLLHHVPAAAGRQEGPRPGLRHHAVPPARRGRI